MGLFDRLFWAVASSPGEGGYLAGEILSHATLEPLTRLYCSFPAHFTVRQGIIPSGPDPMCSHSLGSEQLLNWLSPRTLDSEI